MNSQAQWINSKSESKKDSRLFLPFILLNRHQNENSNQNTPLPCWNFGFSLVYSIEYNLFAKNLKCSVLIPISSYSEFHTLASWSPLFPAWAFGSPPCPAMPASWLHPQPFSVWADHTASCALVTLLLSAHAVREAAVLYSNLSPLKLIQYIMFSSQTSSRDPFKRSFLTFKKHLLNEWIRIYQNF